METLVELSWRGYPAAMLLLLGALVVAHGLRQWWDGARRPVRDPEKNLTWMLGFRRVFVGLALAGTGAAWAWQLPWLLALTLAVCGEETLESSICIAALRQARHHAAARRAGAPLLPRPA